MRSRAPHPGRIVLVMNTRAFLTPGRNAGRDVRPEPALPVQDRQRRRQHRGQGRPGVVHRNGHEPAGGSPGPGRPAGGGGHDERAFDRHARREGCPQHDARFRDRHPGVRRPARRSFFIDLEAAFCILPDRKPSQGPLSSGCALPANPAPPFYFRSAGQAVNYVNGFNVLSIVVELPLEPSRAWPARPARHLGHHQPLTHSWSESFS